MKRFILSIAVSAIATASSAQTTEQDTTRHYFRLPNAHDNIAYASSSRNVLFVNETITTHLVMPENIKLVDLSTDKIAGNQCADNIVRIKPNGLMKDQEFLGTITMIGERNIVQYDLVYTKFTKQAAPLLYISPESLTPYLNPAVKMPQKEMGEYAWAIYTSGRKFHNITSKAYGMTMVVNNIYSVGDFFFIDFSLHNHTNIKYDIDELRFKLIDKKETKATNSQMTELSPEYILHDEKTFKKTYRNVVVLKKMTFPEEKVLLLEVYENQISGRTISLPISYEDILHADAISEAVMKRLPSNR